MLLLADDPTPLVTMTKVLLATVVVGLAGYQVFLAAVLYGRLRPRFLAGRVAGRAHRLVGLTTALVALVVAVICVSGYEVWDALEDGGAAAAHVVFAAAVLVVLLVKIVIVHRGGRAGRLLPYLGVTVAGLFVAVWATSSLPLLG